MKKIISGLCIIVSACTTHQKVVRTQTPSIVASAAVEVKSLKRKVAISRFTNETQYAKGLFYDKNNSNPIEKQASDILSTKLAASGKFLLLERQDLDKITEELKLAGSDAAPKVAADYLIVGSVTEFGRKNVGDNNVFSRSKTQTVSAGVSLRLIDVSTGQIIYSEEGKGEASAIAKTVMGLGETADFDASLNDKAISAAISKLVENIINNCMNRPWKTYFISAESNEVLVSGGKSQGIKVGDKFEVYEKGKSVKNPQTGILIELPGKKVGVVKVESVGGDSPQNEFSMVSFTEGSIDKVNISNYLIKESH